MCGELHYVAVRNRRYSGSSPRVWGTPLGGLLPHGQLRFIPACVGNSSHALKTVSTCTVHPRVCGELSGWTVTPTVYAGSSPRVWGTLVYHSAHRVMMRFIPACVGNSITYCCPITNVPVHPRVCGELPSADVYPNRGVGSSPRVWGTLQVNAEIGAAARFIPACVGNSALSRAEVFGLSVHPRVCGELSPTVETGWPTQGPDGSSPRVWGTHFHLRGEKQRKGFNIGWY